MRGLSGAAHLSAYSWPDSVVTSLCSVRSDLLPTKMMTASISMPVVIGLHSMIGPSGRLAEAYAQASSANLNRFVSHYAEVVLILRKEGQGYAARPRASSEQWRTMQIQM